MIVRLAWRSIWRNRRRTLITIASLALGLTIAIFFIALSEGVHNQVVNEAVRMQAGHITVEHEAYQAAPAVDLFIGGVDRLRRRIDGMEAVEATKLLIRGQGVANSSAGAVGVAVMGVEPSVEAGTSPLARHMVTGSTLEDGDDRKAILGEHLADQLKLTQGSKLVLTTNNARGELVEELCRVKGIFRIGSDEIDGYLVQIPLEFAQRVFGLQPDEATQLGVVLKRPSELEATIGAIKAIEREEYAAVLPWQAVLPEVASYIRLRRTSTWVFQSLLFIIILFTILNTLLMSVVEREREFAVLLALGTRIGQLRRQLFVESAFIGILGCVAGMSLGGAAALSLQVHGLDLSGFMPGGVDLPAFPHDSWNRLSTAILQTMLFR